MMHMMQACIDKALANNHKGINQLNLGCSSNDNFSLFGLNTNDNGCYYMMDKA
jgi:hypothetical protein